MTEYIKKNELVLLSLKLFVHCISYDTIKCNLKEESNVSDEG